MYKERGNDRQFGPKIYAIISKYRAIPNLQDFLLEFLIEDDLAEEDERLKERLDIELIRVMAERNIPSSDGLKQENTLPSEDA